MNVFKLGAVGLLSLVLCSNSSVAVEKLPLAQPPGLPSQRWPAAPVNAKLLQSNEQVFKLQIEAPSFGAPPFDPLQNVTSSGAFKGLLVYTPMIQVPDNPPAQTYLVLRQIGAPAQKPVVATYPMNVTERVYDPQLSPDGRCLVFKLGDPDAEYGPYRLCFWDLKAATLHQFPTLLAYGFVYWSPDSQHLAFIDGGDQQGIVRLSNDNLHLHIYDRRTGKAPLIASGVWVKSLAWTTHNTLLYSMRPNQTNPPAVTRNTVSSTRPSIYEVSADGLHPHQVIDEGYHPLPSPDGRWIAFWGWYYPSQEPGAGEISKQGEPRQTSYGVGLYLYDCKKQQRIFLSSLQDDMVQLQWSPDSKRLILLTEEPQPNKSSKDQAAARIAAFDNIALAAADTAANTATATMERLKQLTPIATLQAEDFKFAARGQTVPRFHVAGMSKDGSMLFVKISEYIGEEEDYYTERKSLQGIDLQSKKVTQVAQIYNKWGSVIGWDWHEDALNLHK